MENLPGTSLTVAIRLAGAALEGAPSELQHIVDSVFHQFGFARIESGEFSDISIITYQGFGNFDRPALESEILGRLGKLGVPTKGEGRKIAIVQSART
jgi:hypothetical protein